MKFGTTFPRGMTAKDARMESVLRAGLAKFAPNAFLISFVFLTSCSSSQVRSLATVSREPEATAPSQGLANGLVVPSPALVTGNAYLVLSTELAPYLHRLVRVPTACLVGQIPCPSPEVIASYPEEGVSVSHLYWSPDKRRALILDTYEPRVLVFEPQGDVLHTLLENVLIIRDDLIWLPDGRPVFVTQSADYASELVAIIWREGMPQLETLAVFDGIAYLLGSDASNRVLVGLDIYGFPTENSSLKKEVVDVQVLAVDPATGITSELWEQVDWLSQRPQSVLPDDRWLIFGSDDAILWDIQSGLEIPLGDVIWPIPSPDKRSLAMSIRRSDLFNVRVVDIETLKWDSLADLPVAPKLFWTPDGQHIVMAGFGESSTSLASLLVVAPEGGSLLNPQIDLGEYSVVEDVSWGP